MEQLSLEQQIKEQEELEKFKELKSEFKAGNIKSFNQQQKNIILKYASMEFLAELFKFQCQNKSFSFGFGPKLRRKVGQYITNNLAEEEYYDPVFAEVKEYKFKVNEKVKYKVPFQDWQTGEVIARNWNGLWYDIGTGEYWNLENGKQEKIEKCMVSSLQKI